MSNNNKITFKHTENFKSSLVKVIKQVSTYEQSLMQPLRILYVPFIKESVSGKLKIIQKLSITLLFLSLPWNLGKHFYSNDSFINFLPIPYLIKTFYVQDLLVLSAILVGFFYKRNQIRIFGFQNVMRLLFLFILAAFLSVFFSVRTQPSVYFFIRIFLYFLFFVFSADSFLEGSTRSAFLSTLIINTLLLSILGIFQYTGQSSVFNNYLIFGEQPYNIYTPYIAKEVYHGDIRIPPYGTFAHPNIFAGFLAISLTYIIGCCKTLSARRPALLIVVMLGMYVLYLTKSYTSWAAMLLGISLSFKFWRLLVFPLAVAILVLGFIFPTYSSRLRTVLPKDSMLSDLSVGRRSNLMSASYRMLLKKPLYGWGLNSFTYSFKPFYSDPTDIRFVQPVHNVYALVAVETGVFGLVTFLSVTLYSLYLSLHMGNRLYSVILLEVILISSLDHYFYTIHQTYLLYILTLMLALTYTKDKDCL